MTEPPQLPARFQPLRQASRRRRRWLFLLGPLMWVVSLVAVAYVIRRDNAIEIALLVMTASFGVGLLWVGWTRIARAREERAA